METWKTLSLDPRYSVSSLGNIHGPNKRYLKFKKDRYGYFVVGIGRKTYTVHKIVSLCFLGERKDGYEVNHIDGIKTNNNISNLEYVTPQDNIKHAYALGLMNEDSKRRFHLSKLELHKLVWSLPTVALAKQFNVSDTAIKKRCKLYNIPKPTRGFWNKINAGALDGLSCPLP